MILNFFKDPTIASTLHDAYTGDDGYPGGLYQGLSAQLAKGIISMGVTIMVKERYAYLAALWNCADVSLELNRASFVLFAGGDNSLRSLYLLRCFSFATLYANCCCMVTEQRLVARTLKFSYNFLSHEGRAWFWM